RAEHLPPRHEKPRQRQSPFTHTDLKERVAALKSAMSDQSQKLAIPHDELLQPALVKTLTAQSHVDVGAFLAEAGARPWQIELSAPVLTDALARLPRA